MSTITPIAGLGTEYLIFAVSGGISLVIFVGLILVPVLGSFSNYWEKFAAGLLSVFVLAALVLIGLALGLLIFYHWDSLSRI